MTAFEQTLSLAKTLKLKGITSKLDEIIEVAAAKNLSYQDFLNLVFETEIEDRKERRLQRNMSAAHFPILKSLDTFQFDNVKGISQRESANLLDCRWIDRKENILFFGPPGLGKTHLAISLGLNAVEKGYTVCFERMNNLIRLLKTSQIQRQSEFRINKILKSNVLIIDEIGYTPIDRNEANLFFSLVSELYEKESIIITSNKSFENWAEMLGDQVMTTALLDRLLHHAKVYNLSGKSYRLQKNTEVK